MSSYYISDVVRLPIRRIRVWARIRRMAFSGPPVIKVHGLLRTGTNYMQKLLNNNFDVVCLGDTESGWKHGPCNYKSYINYVFLVKNPYSWVRSFMEWEKIHKRIGGITLEEFLVAPVSHPELREAWSVSNPVEAWNRTLESWTRYMSRGNVVFIRYEDLLGSFDEQMSGIRDSLGLDMKSDSFVNITARADNWKTPKPRKSLDRDYYLNKTYLEECTPGEMNIIAANLDDQIVRQFGYEV